MQGKKQSINEKRSLPKNGFIKELVYSQHQSTCYVFYSDNTNNQGNPAQISRIQIDGENINLSEIKCSMPYGHPNGDIEHSLDHTSLWFIFKSKVFASFKFIPNKKGLPILNIILTSKKQ